MSEAASITVAVRIRPPTSYEADRLPGYDDLCDPVHFMGDGHLTTPRKLATAKTLRHIVRVMDDQVLVFDPPDEDAARALQQRGYLPPGTKRYKDQRYKFDRVFAESATQQDVFEHTTKSLLDGIFNGFNATVFAYGATGCGKTYTISGTETDQGVIYRTMNELFSRIEEQRDEQIVDLSVSYLEIYNENIRDLLSDVNTVVPKGGLQLREDKDCRVTVANLTELHPATAEEVQVIVQTGNARRTQSPTHANETSSRSHAVLQVNVTQCPRTASTTETRMMATLSIIDLAGSERASATKNMGERMVEGANINKSLLALGNCINALCESGGRTRHIPYRNSKLTRLLKFSLGGNCKTVMIVCVAPTSAHFDDTQNTLKYANRAKEIKTKISKNLINVDRHVAQYVEAIQRLNGEVAELKAKLAGKISIENDVENRRKADARAEAEKVKADMCARVEQARAVLVEGATCEASRDAADIVLRTLRPRLDRLDAEASAGPLDSILQAEREYLSALAASHQSLLNSDASRACLQRSENSRSMLEATLRAVSERRADRLDDVSAENVKLVASLKRAEMSSARTSAREEVLKAALIRQSQLVLQLLGVFGNCGVASSEVAGVEGTLPGSMTPRQALVAALMTGGPASPLPMAAPTPIFLSAPPIPIPVPMPRKRSSLLPDGPHLSPRKAYPTKSPRKSLSRRQSLSQSSSMSALYVRPTQAALKRTEKKSLRWRDEAGEGDIDDAGMGGQVQDSASTQKTGSSSPDTEWEDEKTDDSFNTSKDSSTASIPVRRPRTSRFDPNYLKAKRLSSLGEEDENTENQLGVGTPKKGSRRLSPLAERGNLPLPEELSDESISAPSKGSKLNLYASPPPKPRIMPMSAGKGRRVSNIGPIRVQKPKRRTSLIPQPHVAETDVNLKASLGGAKRVVVNGGDGDVSVRRSPVKKASLRTSVSHGPRPSMSMSMSMRGPFRTSVSRPNLSASLSVLPTDPNSSSEGPPNGSTRGKAAWR